MALAQARTATDAIRAQLTAEKIQAQQRIATFDKTKQEIEVITDALTVAMPCKITGGHPCPGSVIATLSCGAADG